MSDIPFIAVGNNELGEPTEAVACKHCGQEHPIEYGTSKTLLPDGVTWSEPVPSKMLGFYQCGEKMYLGTIEGRAFRSKK